MLLALDILHLVKELQSVTGSSITYQVPDSVTQHRGDIVTNVFQLRTRFTISVGAVGPEGYLLGLISILFPFQLISH